MNIITGTLFDDKTVYLDDRALGLGGAWWDTGRAYHDNMLRWFYRRFEHATNRMNMLDIGASTGAYALLAAHLPSLYAYAFEPYRVAYDVLTENVRLNKINDRVKTFPVGFSDHTGMFDLHVAQPDNIAGLSMLGGTPVPDRQYKTQRVITTTADLFVQANSVRRVDVLKVDVEGGELAVLRGAAHILEHDQPLVIAEYSEANAAQFGYHPDEMVRYLESFGYTVIRDHEDIIAEVKHESE